MSDQDTTAAVADTPSADRAPTVELQEVLVLASGFSYFTKEKVLGPDGEQLEDPNTGRLQFVTLRHEATRGDKISMMPYEAKIAIRDGFVTDDLETSLTFRRMATPFTQPVVDEDGETRAFEGPIMGDPRPNSADETGRDVERMPLSAQQIEELALRARDRENADSFSVDESTDDELNEFVSTHNADDVVAAAKLPDGSVDEQRATRLLEAEMAQDSPRKTVVDPLEKAVG